MSALFDKLYQVNVSTQAGRVKEWNFGYLDTKNHLQTILTCFLSLRLTLSPSLAYTVTY